MRFLIVCALLLSACSGQGENMSPSYLLSHEKPPAFEPDRRVFDCARWTPPAAPDEASERWYKMATTLDAKKYRIGVHEYQQKIILYEAAAKKGHYKAIKDLIILYNEGGYAMGQEFAPEPLKARHWLDVGLAQGWPSAFEWLATAIHFGYAGYGGSKNEVGLAYLQKAANMGAFFAQYQLALLYGNVYDRVEAEKSLLNCSAEQGFAPAARALSIYKEINGLSAQALQLNHIAISGGGERGEAAAMVMEGAFSGEIQFQIDLNTEIDLERAQAYKELKLALGGTDSSSGNGYYTFPRLNEVLPLPPAKMPPWRGIYSAMSEEDAAYYQNLPNPGDLIEEVRAAGLLIDQDYLSQPREMEEDEDNDL